MTSLAQVPAIASLRLPHSLSLSLSRLSPAACACQARSGRMNELDEQMIELTIEALTGTVYDLCVSPFETILGIKMKIQRLEGRPQSINLTSVRVREACVP